MRACLWALSVKILRREEATVSDLQEEEVDSEGVGRVRVVILVRGVDVDGDLVSRL